MIKDYIIVGCLLFVTGTVFGAVFTEAADLAGVAFGTVEQPTEIVDYVISKTKK